MRFPIYLANKRKEDYMVKKWDMYINGEWVPAESGAYYDDMNPWTGELYAQIADGDEADIEKAIAAADAAFPAWRDTPPFIKRRLLNKAADIAIEKEEEIRLATVEECAGCAPFWGFTTFSVTEYLREAASQVFMVRGEVIPTDTPEHLAMEWVQPLGVVGSITPWNAAAILGTRGIACPIAYGNTVVLKSSECSAVAGSLILAEIFDEAGFPPGVFNVITVGPGKSRIVGDKFTSDKRVKAMHFTGSTTVGVHLNEQCAKYCKPIALELGGDDPILVLDGADLEYAASCATIGRLMHNGQICMGTKRVVVVKELAEEMEKKLVEHFSAIKYGDPADPTNFISCLMNDVQIKECCDLVENAKAQGAKVLYGCELVKDRLYMPSVIEITEDMDIAQQEVFGPVLKVLIAEDEADAIRIANNTDFGLSAGIVCGDIGHGIEVARAVESGICHINDCSLDDHPSAPFGGAKMSGVGNNGIRTIDHYTQTRWVTVTTRQKQYPC